MLADPWESAVSLAPMVPRKLLEKDVQKSCVAWARGRGWWARKFSSPANRSVPDYIFGKDGCTVFVEFKAPGKKATDNQLEEHKLMEEVGLAVHVIDNVLPFKGLFMQIENQIADGIYKKAP